MTQRWLLDLGFGVYLNPNYLLIYPNYPQLRTTRAVCKGNYLGGPGSVLGLRVLMLIEARLARVNAVQERNRNLALFAQPDKRARLVLKGSILGSLLINKGGCQNYGPFFGYRKY